MQWYSDSSDNSDSSDSTGSGNTTQTHRYNNDVSGNCDSNGSSDIASWVVPRTCNYELF